MSEHGIAGAVIERRLAGESQEELVAWLGKCGFSQAQIGVLVDTKGDFEKKAKSYQVDAYRHSKG